MRIVAGSRRGAKLYTGKIAGFRPTSDRVRESIFSILGDRVTGARVLDLFAGSGALGFEALSRGAAETLFVERRRTVVRWIERNGFALRFEGLWSAITGDALEILAKKGRIDGYDLVFADPPYRGGFIGPVLRKLGALPGSRLVVIERDMREEPEGAAVTWTESRRYGDTVVDFLLAGKEAG